jgi:N-acylneuraminate cytidylyltransferase
MREASRMSEHRPVPAPALKLAVIPARGGSKRIPRKNIRDFCGQPMVAWSIRAALDSGCFDHVLVSTDDEEIARVALDAGAEVPFRRPDELSGDFTPTNEVVTHAVGHYEAAGARVERVACIYATAPFLTADVVRQGMAACLRPGADFAAVVTHYRFPIQRALGADANGMLRMREPQHIASRSQDLEMFYHDAGQFYCGAPAGFARFRSVFEGVVAPVVVPPTQALDIDTSEDWDAAEIMFRQIIETHRGNNFELR